MQPQPQPQHNHQHQQQQQPPFQGQTPGAYCGAGQTAAQPLQQQHLVSIPWQCTSASSDSSERRRRLQQAEAMYQTGGQQWNSPMQSNHTQDLKAAVMHRISLSTEGAAAPPPQGMGYCDSGFPTGAHFPTQGSTSSQQQQQQDTLLRPEVGGLNHPSPLDGHSQRNSATVLPPSGSREAALEGTRTSEAADTDAVIPEEATEAGTLGAYQPAEECDKDKPFQFASVGPRDPSWRDRSRSFQGSEAVLLLPKIPEKKELLNKQIQRRQQALVAAKQRLAEGWGAKQVLEALSKARRTTDAGGGSTGAAERATRQGLRFRSFDGSGELSAESLSELIGKGMAQGATAEEVVEQACSLFVQEAPVLEKIQTRGNSFGFP